MTDSERIIELEAQVRRILEQWPSEQLEAIEELRDLLSGLLKNLPVVAAKEDETSDRFLRRAEALLEDLAATAGIELVEEAPSSDTGAARERELAIEG